MTKKILMLFTMSLLLMQCKNEAKTGMVASSDARPETEETHLKITPINHATLVIAYGDTRIFVDPTGGSEAFKSFPSPNFVLITDIHGDHYNLETLQALQLSKTKLIAPKAVIDKLPEDLQVGAVVSMANGDHHSFETFKIEAIPMYNLREEALKFHPKGRGNGYVLTINDERIYISGDTEDIPEMRNLEDIDKAFVCMNLPYTMPVEKAAEAVLEFKPKAVYPYHYRGTEGLSDVDKFKTLVNQGDADIDVIQWNWYE